jgi:hypothetical protein
METDGVQSDNRVERSLYNRAVGYSFQAEKIFCNKDGIVTHVPYIEHVPPDVTVQIFWLKNRDPAHWRDHDQERRRPARGDERGAHVPLRS